jgi:fatty-acyl-CoA synthase
MRSIDYFDCGHDAGPDRTALIDAESGARFTFADVKALTERIAAAMARGGFVNQSPVALYAPNSASVMIALLAIWRANGKWVPVNTRNAITANIGYLDYVRCEWIFYHSSLVEDVAALRAACPNLKHFVCLDADLGKDPSLERFIAEVTPDDFISVDVDAFANPDDVVGIFPTGGTTGPSKGVEVTNLGWSVMQETLGAAVDGRTDDPVSLVVAPITHAAGPVALATMALGATQVILSGFDPELVLRTIAGERVTHMYLPPTALYGLLGSSEIGHTTPARSKSSSWSAPPSRRTNCG